MGINRLLYSSLALDQLTHSNLIIQNQVARFLVLDTKEFYHCSPSALSIVSAAVRTEALISASVVCLNNPTHAQMHMLDVISRIKMAKIGQSWQIIVEIVIGDTGSIFTNYSFNNISVSLNLLEEKDQAPEI